MRIDTRAGQPSNPVIVTFDQGERFSLPMLRALVDALELEAFTPAVESETEPTMPTQEELQAPSRTEVLSDTGYGSYTVESYPDGRAQCDCADYQYRSRAVEPGHYWCKHIRRVLAGTV